MSHTQRTNNATFDDTFRIIEDVDTIIFIDGRNTHYAMYNLLKKRANFAKLKDYFHYRTRLLRSFYYTAIVNKPQKDAEGKEIINREGPPPGLKKFLTSLENFGYVVETKKVIANSFSSVANTIQFEMVADLMHYVLTNNIKQVILFSSEPAFVPTLNALRRSGVYINVCTIYKWQSNVAGSEETRDYTASRIRHAADNFIDLEEVINAVGSEEIKTSFPVNEEVAEIDLDELDN